MFALFDFGRARALTPSELGILLLSLGRALESFMGLRRGKSCVAFEDMAALDNAARVAVGKYDGALKQGMREGRGGGEDVSDAELEARRAALPPRARRPRGCRARTSSSGRCAC